MLLFLVVGWLVPQQVIGQEVDSLSHYLAIAAENNQEVQASFRTYEASLQKIPQAGAYEDPKLDIGFYLKPMDIVGGRSVANFTIMQMFPWFGTRKAARDEATHMAKMAYEEFREARDNVFAQVYTQWYGLITLKQQIIINQQNIGLLMKTRELAMQRFISSKPASSYASSTIQSSNDAEMTSTTSSSSMGGMSGMGGGSSTSSGAGSASSGMDMGSSPMAGMSGSTGGGMSEVVRIEIELAELESNLESAALDLESQIGLFNTLLDRPVDSPLAIPEELEQLPFQMDLEYINEVKENNPMLAMYIEEELGYRAMGKMNKKMSYPMIGLGLQYMLINKTSDPMLAMGNMNGKDMFMPMVSISLPIYRNKYKAQQRESKLLQQAARNKYQNTLNVLESALLQTQNLLDNLDRKIKLYAKQSKLAQTSFELGLKEYVAGQTDLTSLIQIHRQLLDYKLKIAESIAAYNTQVVAIQKLGSFNHLKM